MLAVARVMDRTWRKMSALITVAYHTGLRVGSILRTRGGTTMKVRLFLIALSAIGVCALPSTSDSNALRVVDSRGQFVGMLMGDHTLMRQFDNKWYTFGARMTGFSADTGVNFYYQSSNCTGAAYVELDVPQLPRTVGYLSTRPSEAKFYVPIPNTGTNITVASFRYLTATTNTCFSDLAPFPHDVALPTLFDVTTTLPWRTSD